MSSADQDQKLAGMTVNERLFELGLIDAFDMAVRRRDRIAATDVLVRAKLSLQQAQETVQAIFADPKRYGY